MGRVQHGAAAPHSTTSTERPARAPPLLPPRPIIMDFWNRLIGGSGSSVAVAQKAPPPLTPQQRLQKFKRSWQTLLHSWRNARENDISSQDMLRAHIKRLSDLLVEEEKRSAARLCMNFCYDQQIFIALSKMGQAGSPGVIRECIAVFSMLIDNEEDDFLGQESFAQSLAFFLRDITSRNSKTFEGEVVELLFSIAAKIRMKPGILSAWFVNNAGDDSDSGRGTIDSRERFAGSTKTEDFPLFYLLIDYVHHEGRVGDFARTGLLYIIEAASSTGELERWIAESDLATLMASGLGALYSQLSRKLVVTYPTDAAPTILVLSDYSSSPPSFGAENTNSREFQGHLETFLSYLTFWQDVLEHCRSAEVKQTLLDHFQILFLQQLLYPSLLESSDIDGGSSVAVLTYVRVILDTMEHPDIIHLILSYLMALREKPKPVSTAAAVARRRKSLDLLSQVANIADNPTPDLFNLGDLVLTSLGSKSQQTVSATLRLISTILRKHYPYAMGTLIKTSPVAANAPARTIGAHNKEMEMLFSMVADISEENNAEESYQDHLKDCLVLLESHPCSGKLLGLKESTSRGNRSEPEDAAHAKLHGMSMHTLQPNDPLLRNLVDLLGTFFSNTVETNLTLTCVIVDLAACAWMRPEGWLLFDPATYEFVAGEDDTESEDDHDELEEMEDELAAIMGDTTIASEPEDIFAESERRRLRDLKRARREPRNAKMPPILSALSSLVSQIGSYRRDIPDLDNKLAERRQAFEFTDELNEALASPQQKPLPARPPPSPPLQSASFLQSLDAISAYNLVRPSSRQGEQASSPPPAQYQRHSRVNSRTAIVDSRGSSPSPFGSHVADTMQRRIRVLQPGQQSLHRPPPPEENGEGSERGAPMPPPKTLDEPRDFTLNHLLTNIMILQEFILELAALVQVRASLFGDVRFA